MRPGPRAATGAAAAVVALAVTSWAGGAAAADDDGTVEPRLGGERLSFEAKGGGEGLSLEAAGGDVVLGLGALLQLDAAAFDAEGADLDDGADVRRARLRLEAALYDRFDAEFEYNFAAEAAPIESAFVGYSPGTLIVAAGNFFEPFNLARLIFPEDRVFLEPGLASALAPGRNVGLAAFTRGETWTLAGGVFGGNINRDFEDDGLAATARATYAPLLEERRVVHLGLAGSYREPGAAGPIAFTGGPQSEVTDLPLIGTDPIEEGEGVARANLEAALVLGPFSLQAQYIRARVGRGGGRADATFGGGYAFASLFLTGETRPYVLREGLRQGIFGQVEPRAPAFGDGAGFGTGAWEVAARYSFLDLSDDDVRGGRAQAVTLALNWYLSPALRLQGNYIHADTDGQAPVEAADVWALRFQFLY